MIKETISFEVLRDLLASLKVDTAELGRNIRLLISAKDLLTQFFSSLVKN